MPNNMPVVGESDSSKAIVIPRRFDKQCEICLLLDSAETEKMEWHLYEEGLHEVQDKHICNDCLEGLKDIRKQCHLKIDNPHHNENFIQSFIPWFVKEDPNLLAVYNKE
jgi:hypothetical protein